MLQELPINIKFCFEGMEESGSEGLDDLVFSRKDTFFKDVDYVCISDNYWLGKTKPCITYGLRGICYFFLEVRKRCFLSVCFMWCIWWVTAFYSECHILKALISSCLIWKLWFLSGLVCEYERDFRDLLLICSIGGMLW